MPSFESTPTRGQAALIALIVSGMMTCVVSGISTLRARGVMDGFAAQWLASWIISWLVAYPMLLVLHPLVRRAVTRFRL